VHSNWSCPRGGHNFPVMTPLVSLV